MTEDDGLLVGVVQHAQQVGSVQAKHLIQTWTLDLRRQILTESQVEFGNIGTFSQDEDGNLSFEACHAGIASLEYFGLDSITMPRLTRHARSNKRRATPKPTSTGGITIHISRSALHAVATAAACLLLAFLFTGESLSPTLTSRDNVELGSVHLPCSAFCTTAKAPQVLEGPMQSIPSTSSSANPAHSACNAETSAEAPMPCAADPAPATPAPHYVIVLASAISRSNAEHFVQRLQTRGFDSARIFDNGEIIRVVIEDFDQAHAAYSFNKKVHAEHIDLTSSWVLKL